MWTRACPGASGLGDVEARFVNAQVPEVVQPFWAALQRGEFTADAAAAVGTYRKQGTRWWRPAVACARAVAAI